MDWTMISPVHFLWRLASRYLSCQTVSLLNSSAMVFFFDSLSVSSNPSSIAAMYLSADTFSQIYCQREECCNCSPKLQARRGPPRVAGAACFRKEKTVRVSSLLRRVFANKEPRAANLNTLPLESKGEPFSFFFPSPLPLCVVVTARLAF